MAGGFHKACAQTAGKVYCWGGEKIPGELDPPDFADPSHLTAGGSHACVLDEGTVRCWGGGIAEPVNPDDFGNFGQSDPPPLSNPTGVYAGLLHTCAKEDSGLVCWGFGFGYFGGNEPENEPKSGNPKLVAPGANSTCVFDEVNGLGCWVFNPENGGEYGTPTYLRDVPEVQSPTLLSVRWENACVVENREIICWGLEDSGVTNPPQVTNPTILELGNDFGCVLDSGEVICWGDGIGNPPPLSNPYDLAAGGVFACAADDTGVVCWGGDGLSPGITEPPAALRDPSK